MLLCNALFTCIWSTASGKTWVIGSILNPPGLIAQLPFPCPLPLLEQPRTERHRLTKLNGTNCPLLQWDGWDNVSRAFRLSDYFSAMTFSPNIVWTALCLVNVARIDAGSIKRELSNARIVA